MSVKKTETPRSMVLNVIQECRGAGLYAICGITSLVPAEVQRECAELLRFGRIAKFQDNDCYVPILTRGAFQDSVKTFLRSSPDKFHGAGRVAVALGYRINDSAHALYTLRVLEGLGFVEKRIVGTKAQEFKLIQKR